jgi:hypothetical protein
MVRFSDLVICDSHSGEVSNDFLDGGVVGDSRHGKSMSDLGHREPKSLMRLAIQTGQSKDLHQSDVKAKLLPLGESRGHLLTSQELAPDVGKGDPMVVQQSTQRVLPLVQVSVHELRPTLGCVGETWLFQVMWILESA